jgi:VWFA-related protein
VSLDFPWQALLHEFRDGTLYAKVGSLVMVYRKDGTLAARYSDFACCDYGNEKKSNASEQQAESRQVVAQPDGADALLPDRYEKQFTLPPGDYQVRAVISDGVHFGVQEAPLTVASYDASKPGISDVVLSRRARKLTAEATEAAAQVAKSYTPLISKGVEFTPTPNPQFRPSDTMFAYFEINEPLVGGQPRAKVQVNIRIVDRESGVEVDTFAPVDTTTYSTAGSPLIAVARGVPLKRLKPGVYRLDVQARNVGGKSTEWRSAVFTVMEAAPLELSETAPPKKEEVIVNVSALDSSGRPVTDLTNADFQIFEDEKAQTTASFRETSAGKPGAHFSALVVILFDLLNTYPEEREYVADRIIKTLQPLEAEEGIYVYLLTNDGALVSVRPKGTPQAAAIAQGSIAGESSEKTEEGPPWTKDIRPLLVNAVKQVNGFRLDDYKDEYWRTSLTFQKLDELARDFDIIRGPKTLLWVTSGVPMKTNTPYACEDAVIHRDTSSYVAGKCSQECPQPRAPDMASLMMNCLDYTPFLEHFSAEAAESDTVVSSVAETETGLQDFVPGTAANLLKQLGDSTGGHVYLNTNREMEKAVREAVEASKGRYRLEFASASRDGKYHKVRVVCTRQSVHIVAPQGYFAPAP